MSKYVNFLDSRDKYESRKVSNVDYDYLANFKLAERN